VAVTAEGTAEVTLNCGDGDGATAAAAALVDARTGGLVKEGLALVRCRERGSGAGFRLTARIYVVESALAEALGFEGEAHVTLGAHPPRYDRQLLSSLTALASDRRATILATPEAQALDGRDVELTAGGEFAVALEARDATDRQDGVERIAWKQHGLALKARVLSGAPGTARVRFQVSLKSRVGAAGHDLAADAAASEVAVALGRPTLAAVLYVEQASVERRETPLFARLPIFGPLFRLDEEASSRARAFFWLTVKRSATEPP
jgi:hypothetical protein